MINTIVHFSDLHIKLFKDHDLYRLILTNAFEEWKKFKPDRILFTGDLLHSKNQLTPELVEFSSWVLTKCASIAKTIIIIGNHDFLTSNTSRLDSLSPIINALNNPNIIYYKDRGVYEDENVSWCVYSQFQDNIPPDISSAKGYKLGIFHGPIQNLKTDLGFEFGDEAYDITKFNGLNCVFAGDIHKRAEFPIPNGKRGIMIGSFLQLNHGENISNHGYGIYNIDKDEYKYVNLSNPKPYLKFKINSFDDILDSKEILLNA